MRAAIRWDPPRYLFIDALNAEVPQAAHEIAFLFEDYLDLEHVREHTLDWSALGAACEEPGLKAELQPFRDNIALWAKRFRLDESVWVVDPQWMLDTALYTLAWFESHNHFAREGKLLAMYEGFPMQPEVEDDEEHYVQTEFDIFFGARKFDANVFSLENYKSSVQVEVDAAVDLYLGRISESLAKEGWQKVPEVQHDAAYAWLVNRHVLGKDYSQIVSDWAEERNWAFTDEEIRREKRYQRMSNAPEPEISEADNLAEEKKILNLDLAFVRRVVRQAAEALGLKVEQRRKGRPKKLGI